MLDDIFKKLDLEKIEAETYIALLEGGISSAGKLAKKIGIPRSSLYGYLSRLSDKGLVKQSERYNIKLWQAETPERIIDLLNEKLTATQNLKENLLKVLPILKTKQALDFVAPRFTYFEGIEGLRNALKDILLYRDIETQSFWPIKDMLNVLGNEYLRDHNIKRIKQNVIIKAIWPQERAIDIKKYNFMGTGEYFRREIRMAPKDIDCSMGYWAYEDKVVFVSSRVECFGFIVQSKELRQLMKTQFDILWQMSKPIKINPNIAKEFFKEISI
jgi:sugar-specific transcriptional regulator TrmB